MLIRIGYDIALGLSNPTAIVKSSVVTEELKLKIERIDFLEPFTDSMAEAP